MNHEKMKERIFALYDGELDPATRGEVEAHLGDCAECRELYERWEETAKTFFKAPETKPSEFFVRQVMSGIRELDTPKPALSRARILRWFVPAAALALVLLSIVPVPTQPNSIDTWLSQEMSGSSQWVFSNKALTMDDTLEFVMEESS